MFKIRMVTMLVIPAFPDNICFFRRHFFSSLVKVCEVYATIRQLCGENTFFFTSISISEADIIFATDKMMERLLDYNIADQASLANRRPRRNILFIDDDPDDQELISLAFNNIDPSITLTCVSSGAEGLKVAKEILPDLILLDINIPAMDGADFLKFATVDPELSKIPVIAYSTASREFNETRILGLGAEMYIQKPCTYPEIISQMKELLFRDF